MTGGTQRGGWRPRLVKYRLVHGREVIEAQNMTPKIDTEVCSVSLKGARTRIVNQ